MVFLSELSLRTPPDPKKFRSGGTFLVGRRSPIQEPKMRRGGLARAQYQPSSWRIE
jgi:hypothetical protein